jgi:hypothetical protein
LKISANSDEIITLIQISSNAQGACSLELQQPKFFHATIISFFQNSGKSEYAFCIFIKAYFQRPVLVVVFKYSAGIIISVSISLYLKGIISDFIVVNFCIVFSYILNGLNQ